MYLAAVVKGFFITMKHAIDSLRDSGPADEHYVVRMTEAGQLSFEAGDGTNGRRFPSGTNNLRVELRVGTGLRGNLAAGGLEAPRRIRPQLGLPRVQRHPPQPVSLGRAIGNTDIHLLDRRFGLARGFGLQLGVDGRLLRPQSDERPRQGRDRATARPGQEARLAQAVLRLAHQLLRLGHQRAVGITIDEHLQFLDRSRAAVREADTTGKGQLVDVARYDAVLALTERIVYQHSLLGTSPVPQGNTHPLLCPYGVVRTADGFVTLAAPSDHHWRLLAELMGRPELGVDPRFRTFHPTRCVP